MISGANGFWLRSILNPPTAKADSAENRIRRYEGEPAYLNKQKAIFQFLTNPEIGGYLWNKLFLRKLIEIDKIRFEKDIFICEDLLFVIRYASRIQNCVVVPRKLYNYDIQPNGLTSAAFSMKKVTQLDF